MRLSARRSRSVCRRRSRTDTGMRTGRGCSARAASSSTKLRSSPSSVWSGGCPATPVAGLRRPRRPPASLRWHGLVEDLGDRRDRGGPVAQVQRVGDPQPFAPGSPRAPRRAASSRSSRTRATSRSSPDILVRQPTGRPLHHQALVPAVRPGRPVRVRQPQCRLPGQVAARVHAKWLAAGANMSGRWSARRAARSTSGCWSQASRKSIGPRRIASTSAVAERLRAPSSWATTSSRSQAGA